jgi:hypothetical protein
MATIVEMHVLDELLTTGEWCHHCLLPSALRLPFIGIDPATLETLIRAATFACTECGRSWNVDELVAPGIDFTGFGVALIFDQDADDDARGG